MKFLFLIQGEGRGHLSQAITLEKILLDAGHSVCCTLVGKSERRIIPEYFKRNMHSPIQEIASPNFVTDKQNKSVQILRTIVYNARYTPRFLKSLGQIHKTVAQHQPDCIINFYDFLGGLYSFLYRPKAQYVCVGHQYLAYHPNFPFAPNKPLDKLLFTFNNSLTSWRADLRIALSFSPYAPARIGKLVVTPPLLRQEVFEAKPQTEDFLLAYMVNSGYGEEVMEWSEQHPETRIHCFWDEKSKPEVWEYSPSLTFHQVNDVKFLDYMSRCKGYVSTAGFESICEALYLQKPVLMIPVKGQYEQACNALDAQKAEAGIAADSYQIDLLLDYINQNQGKESPYRAWYQETPWVITQVLEALSLQQPSKIHEHEKSPAASVMAP
ncbi:glycosyltransferase family protein [Cytophagales bacterium LB-30]|uniref:Glycosyltransferase family protein n=1 Tax=Shiella aurantiaca TaxID=3058365 RepID=A0ABT8F3J4_9BACT|nr:glycosyltransferase family protein [Shiella aurantiaca]MDN4164814.1 glycosyltransferase family protein [Shiella aurantiaca]